MFLYQITTNGAALKRWEIPHQPLVVGRGDDAGARIFDYSLSRRHFGIRREGNVFVIEDFESKNGTLVNGSPITRQELNPYDRISAGWVLFSFEPGLSTLIRTLEKEEVALAALPGDTSTSRAP